MREEHDPWQSERTLERPGARTKERQVLAIPSRFVPRFWKDADSRIHVVRVIRRRYEQLKNDIGCDSIQKDLLYQRAAFVSTILETHEVLVAEGGGLDLGAYVQACNALSPCRQDLAFRYVSYNVAAFSAISSV